MKTDPYTAAEQLLRSSPSTCEALLTFARAISNESDDVDEVQQEILDGLRSLAAKYFAAERATM